MTWDPSPFQLLGVKQETPITNADTELRVQLMVNGAGFTSSRGMFGVLVLSGQPTKAENLIPCNNITIVKGDCSLTTRICPARKTPGKYDLLMWLAPAAAVGPPNNRQEDVPVNDIAVLPNAITVVSG